MSAGSTPPEPACPVDHTTRSAWLSNAKPSASCDSSNMDQTPPKTHPKLPSNPSKLSADREISSIPRAGSEGSNSEHGPYQTSGNPREPGRWIYPSEEMFFNAMKRKEWDPKAEDMRTIVPIHNAVNERAWKEIKEWEAGRGSEKCGGPKLVSFSGDSQKLTPKARLRVLFGYHAPFDRHDWTVDRCGKKIDYVIDFYSGKQDPTRPEAVSFYLDVRPKLSMEGAWMRAQNMYGLVYTDLKLNSTRYIIPTLDFADSVTTLTLTNKSGNFMITQQKRVFPCTSRSTMFPIMSSDDDDDDLDIACVVSWELKGSIKIVPKGGHIPISSSEDSNNDLDCIMPRNRFLPTQKFQYNLISEEGEGVDETGDKGSVPAEQAVKTVKHKNGSGDRVLWSDSEGENGYEEWKRKKAEAGGKKRKSAITTKTADNSIGKKTKRMHMERKVSGRKIQDMLVDVADVVSVRAARAEASERQFKIKEECSDELATSEVTLPNYLKARKEAIELAKDTPDDDNPHEALRLPPTYEDIYFSDDERLEELISKPQFETPPCAPYKDILLESSLGSIPCSIAQYLRDYQIEGVEFLHRNFVFQEGCILGDDMGLGKTVQVIAFLTAAFGKTGDERDAKRMRKVRKIGERKWYPRVLLICPGTLISNWRNEFDTWGWWHVDVYHGSKWQKDAALDAARSGRLEVLLTTPTTYKKSCQDINRFQWDCVIVDECHVIKERKAEVTQALNEVNALCRIGLTGTAIQNKYEELWTLLNWCRPGAVSTIGEWKNTIALPLKIGQSHDATLRQIGNAREVARLLVHNLLPKMFLRRMKALIADQLPKKSDKVVFCPLTDRQKSAYVAFLNSEMVEFIKCSSDPCDCGKNKTRGTCCYEKVGDGKRWKDTVFPCIQKIQQLSNHLANWVPTNDDPYEKRIKKLELLQLCLPNDWERISRRELLHNYMDPEMCGKWIVLQKLLKFWHQNDDKVLIFSYSIPLLRILNTLFKTTEYNVSYLDGSMSLDDRSKAVAEFNSDPAQFVFLISTRAGGVGLNITAANKVVIFDPNWNPSYDLQAQDRAYRIGQTRDVEVFRLISAGTIEEIVYARQIYKQQQANIGYGASEERRYFSGVQGDKTNQGELFGLKNLFSFQENTILKEIVNKTNVAESRAGVVVARLEGGEENDDEFEEDPDGVNALNQLVAIVAGEKSAQEKKKKAHNPISAILAEAGISYTHENSEVIGTSKVEAQISRRAVETTKDADMGDIIAFGNKGISDEGYFDGYKFHPPMSVMRRQFCTMSKMFGIEDVREFALVVEGWTQKQRRDALDKFYKLRRDTVVKGEEVNLEDFQPEEFMVGVNPKGEL